ncbi:hypothetical protein [Motiliproteus sp. MSK22-1]|uniref:hypothetical protein n=1 Tax=Motiliproteus sp. MSK22-1 TaxID=1897630 RepID=UPI00097818A6|nr:hypothetical protein [Motiliproteus sp. MSK22-1]OMH38045.1 hypothetical protein BGP75_07110 [Motiliproteus sp. MSK22-1]
MLSPVEELKIRAKKLLKQEPVDTGLLALSKKNSPQLKHCQLFIARQYGFRDWQHAQHILSCSSAFPTEDYGRFWYTNQCSTLLNHWCRDYREALAVQQARGGILLPYRTQFVVADRPYLRLMGLDYDDELWGHIDYNWCQGAIETRQTLALQRIQNGKVVTRSVSTPKPALKPISKSAAK